MPLIIHRVTVVLSGTMNQFIKFPQSQEDRDIIKQGFYNFPCLIGCVDGTHFKIIAPSENEKMF